MRVFSRFSFVVACAALALGASALFSPSADAQLVTYFNFNDQNLTSDAPGAHLTDTATVTKLNTTYIAPSNAGNVATGDPIASGAANNFYLHLVPSGNGQKSFQFTTSTAGLDTLALSFAIQGSGFTSTTIQYTVITGTNAGQTGTIGTQSITSTWQTSPLFDLPSTIENQTLVQFQFVFNPTNPNGSPFVDLDNIQLKKVPEPTTTAAGVLAIIGLCWHQRRRLLTKRKLFKFSRQPAS